MHIYLPFPFIFAPLLIIYHTFSVIFVCCPPEAPLFNTVHCPSPAFNSPLQFSGARAAAVTRRQLLGDGRSGRDGGGGAVLESVAGRIVSCDLPTIGWPEHRSGHNPLLLVSRGSSPRARHMIKGLTSGSVRQAASVKDKGMVGHQWWQED